MKQKNSRSEYLRKKRINSESKARINNMTHDFSAYNQELREKNEKERIERIEAKERAIVRAQQKAEDEMLSKMTPEQQEEYHQKKRKMMKETAERLGRMAGLGML